MNLAKDILANLNNRHIVLLQGDLGVGKTTLAKGIAKVLGVDEVITSPSYVLMKIYKLKNKFFKRLVHVDLYRIEFDVNVDDLGLTDYLRDPESLVVVEWPERIKGSWPESVLKIDLAYSKNLKIRIIEY